MGRTLIRRYSHKTGLSGPRLWSIKILPINMILAIPFSTMVVILLLWFGITTPLTFLGAFYGYKKRAIEHPVRTNTIPRTIPEQIFYTKPLPGIVMGGILPFGCIFIQLFFIMNSIWSHQVRIYWVSSQFHPRFSSRFHFTFRSTICLDLFSWSHWFWSLHVRKPQFYFVISIWLPKIIDGGGEGKNHK